MPPAPCRNRRCRSARPRPAARGGRSPRGRWRRAAARRPTGSPAARSHGRRGRPRRASRAPGRRCLLRSRRRCAAAARHCRTPRGGGRGESPGTPPRCGGGRRAAPSRGSVGQILAEQAKLAAGRPLGEVEQLQQRGLAGARRPGEEIEGAALKPEIEIAQDFGAGAVAQPNPVKFDDRRQSNPPTASNAGLAPPRPC